jgi:hypothetical protein
LKASTFYRIAAVLLLLFAVGHTLGFRQSDPRWGVDALIRSMRLIHFGIQGFSRSYWDFYLGAGYAVGVFLIFAAILAWQLAGLQTQTLAQMRGIRWSFALCFAAITAVSWKYLFCVPFCLLAHDYAVPDCCSHFSAKTTRHGRRVTPRTTFRRPLSNRRRSHLGFPPERNS